MRPTPPTQPPARSAATSASILAGMHIIQLQRITALQSLVLGWHGDVSSVERKYHRRSNGILMHGCHRARLTTQALLHNRNIIHGSDAVESAQKEIALWFPEGVNKWQPATAGWVYENPQA